MFSNNLAECKIEYFSDVPILVISGDVTGDCEDLVLQKYEDAAKDNVKAVGVQFQKSEYINSSGVAVILKMMKKAKSKNIDIIFVSMTDYYKTVFQIVGLLSVLTVVDNREMLLN